MWLLSRSLFLSLSVLSALPLPLQPLLSPPLLLPFPLSLSVPLQLNSWGGKTNKPEAKGCDVFKLTGSAEAQ